MGYKAISTQIGGSKDRQRVGAQPLWTSEPEPESMRCLFDDNYLSLDPPIDLGVVVA